MVGRLDRDSTGLLLLTSDGRLVNALLRAELGHAKRYAVTVDRTVTTAHVRRLAEGVVITTPVQRDRRDGIVTTITQPCDVQQVQGLEGLGVAGWGCGIEFCATLIQPPLAQVGPRSLSITLSVGRNRQLRRMCEALGLAVVSLHREEVSGITLGGLAAWQWAPLDMREMAVVQDALQRASACDVVGRPRDAPWV